MSKITQVEILMVDLQPKVKRVDAIQSFISQQTPILRIRTDDGDEGVGYSYTIVRAAMPSYRFWLAIWHRF
jgi:L-alanine-DL-glutamate epimerase-like enolase superfamily enzyme